MHLLFISLTFITVSYTDYNYLVIDPYQLCLNFAYLKINSHEIQITLHSTFLLMFQISSKEFVDFQLIIQ